MSSDEKPRDPSTSDASEELREVTPPESHHFERAEPDSGFVPEPTSLVAGAWRALGDYRAIVSCREVSAKVTTNRVYDLRLEDGKHVIAKTSSYGNYVHFRQDHQLIHQWSQLLHGRHQNFLAHVVLKDGKVFCHRQGEEWLAFYEKIPFYDFLPKVLTIPQVRSLGSEMAHFHRASARAAPRMNPSWKSMGSEVGTLHRLAGSTAWRKRREFPDEAEHVVRHHCEEFLEQAEALGYHTMPKIPVLVDWNTGNFSVGLEQAGFKFYSRWDYDWFRVEPRAMDFYFCARVVRSDGDQTEFSYLADPFFEPRFLEFLRAYHRVFPLEEVDLLFFKEAYRFFILNHVLNSGEHFFAPRLRRRLQHEALQKYLPRLDGLDFRRLVEGLLG